MKDGIPPSVTTDVWSNNQQDSFVGFELHFVDRAFKVVRKTMGTVPFLATHHTAVEIRKLVNSIAHDSLGVPVDSPVWHPVVTTDSEAAMSKAIDDPMGKLYWVKCSLHILYNTVKAGLTAPGVAGTGVEKMRRFINFLAQSNVAKEQFAAIQQELLDQRST